MRYLKLPDRTELHVWTPLLAARGDMVEVIIPNMELGSTLTMGLPIATKQEVVALPATYTIKSAGFGRYNVLDSEGKAVTENPFPTKPDAEAKLAELTA